MDAATLDTRSDLARDVALAASNLAERAQIVEAVGGPWPDAASPAAHDSAEAWRLETAARRLAEQFAKDAREGPRPAARTATEIGAVLAAFQRIETDPDRRAAAGPCVERVHRAWLPTYRAALTATAADRWAQACPGGAAPWWREQETYYGRLAIGCAPFLRSLADRLGADQAGGPAPPALVRGVQAHLLDRFEVALAWAVETDAKVHCARHGIQTDRASGAQFLRFLDDTFRDGDAVHAFFLRFPMLGRWLALVTRLLGDEASRVWRHLRADRAHLGRALFGRAITDFTGFRFGQGDSHLGARSVIRVSAALAGGEVGAFVYKPRCVRAEAGMQRLLERLRADGVLTTAGREVIARDGYGYEALIPAHRNSVATLAEVRRVYRELGGYLALFYVLGGSDLHMDNIIVADGHAHVCDCETVFGVVRSGDRKDMGSLLDSVFRTGLLEWPRDAEPADGALEVNVSGYLGGEEFEVSTPRPRVNQHRMSYRMAVVSQPGERVRPEAANRVFHNGVLTWPQEHTASILAGFDAVYRWFQRGGRDAASVVAACFPGASTRFLNWGTQLYSQLLTAVSHPRCLMDPLECDLVFHTLRTLPVKHADDAATIEVELAALWRLDVPLFTARVEHDRLVGDGGASAVSTLAHTPLAHVTQRIDALSGENRRRQAAYVAASLATSTQDESLHAAFLAHATRVGERLCQMLRAPGEGAPWRSFRSAGGRLEEVEIEGELYNGSAGVALFLAYLDALSPRPAFRSAAERALEHALASCDRRRLGAFTGVAGLVYLLTHLSTLWHDRRLLHRAVALAAKLEPLVEADREFDVLGGAAGALVVLLGLAQRAEGAGLALAERCAQRILCHAEAAGDTLSWARPDPSEAKANLTGLSHGAGGIGWALIALGAHLDRAELRTAGLRAFQYEASHFDAAESDWPDLRAFGVAADAKGNHFANAWCNGAPGIGLTRVLAWDLTGRQDDALLADARTALGATLRGFPRLGNNTLCHGRAGNAELLLRYAELRGEPAFRLEATVQARNQWRTEDERRPGKAEEGPSFFPGLMLGIAGSGMHCLRLAHPERVPSVLVLDPPPAD